MMEILKTITNFLNLWVRKVVFNTIEKLVCSDQSSPELVPDIVPLPLNLGNDSTRTPFYDVMYSYMHYSMSVIIIINLPTVTRE